ncbi:TetR/AcrR family transcriptional regulator [Nocardia wallacei]|uniref:TetR/AcrR family transcriptional regulator n=1 Tax=Nocardia wallacei TaxID=480035 RepID=UPI002455251F|nr:TetR/AcrR family transcriptional regulator [Nocardia wallacei]
MADKPRRLPRQERSRFTVDTLLEAAAQTFTRDGLATTTNRIAERAGMSIGTLYQYFPNKYAMLHALAQRHVLEGGARLGAVLTELRRTQPPFDDTMRAIVDVVVELHRHRPALHALMHRVVPRDASDLAAMGAFEDYLTAEVAYHLRRCGRGGGDPRRTAAVLVHTVDAQVHRVAPRHAMTGEQLMAVVRQLTPAPSSSGG